MSKQLFGQKKNSASYIETLEERQTYEVTDFIKSKTHTDLTKPIAHSSVGEPARSLDNDEDDFGQSRKTGGELGMKYPSKHKERATYDSV